MAPCSSLRSGSLADRTGDWYERYYGKKGEDRNDLRRNRGVLFQMLALEASLVRAVRALDIEPVEAAVLDVGCGGGGDLLRLVPLGFRPENVVGIDILAERVAEARRLFPQGHFVEGDAGAMQFPAESFDLVFESTMFATLPDDQVSASIAAEMLRVCRPGGYFVLADWRTPKPADPAYKALTRRRLNDLFQVGDATRLTGTFRGALVPPLGRFLSARLPSCYFLVAGLFPFLVGQVTYVLEKVRR